MILFAETAVGRCDGDGDGRTPTWRPEEMDDGGWMDLGSG